MGKLTEQGVLKKVIGNIKGDLTYASKEHAKLTEEHAKATGALEKFRAGVKQLGLKYAKLITSGKEALKAQDERHRQELEEKERTFKGKFDAYGEQMKASLEEVAGQQAQKYNEEKAALEQRRLEEKSKLERQIVGERERNDRIVRELSEARDEHRQEIKEQGEKFASKLEQELGQKETAHQAALGRKDAEIGQHKTTIEGHKKTIAEHEKEIALRRETIAGHKQTIGRLEGEKQALQTDPEKLKETLIGHIQRNAAEVLNVKLEKLGDHVITVPGGLFGLLPKQVVPSDRQLEGMTLKELAELNEHLEKPKLKEEAYEELARIISGKTGKPVTPESLKENPTKVRLWAGLKSGIFATNKTDPIELLKRVKEAQELPAGKIIKEHVGIAGRGFTAEEQKAYNKLAELMNEKIANQEHKVTAEQLSSKPIKIKAGEGLNAGWFTTNKHNPLKILKHAKQAIHDIRLSG
ncbi:hypothetical protein HZC09_05355 [Candidatus Micrarchaeota archaeon]|nr:hypothetical protein [Candidatus Micrarchaeota archaeon]